MSPFNIWSALLLLLYSTSTTASAMNQQSRIFEHQQQQQAKQQGYSGNPIFPGWYADPEARIFEQQYWIYPTYSAAYEEQTFFDAFSSPDLITWTKHPRILNFSDVPWSTNRAAWAPSVAEKHGQYYMYFSAGDGAGIGVATSTTGPGGPFYDAIGKPLVANTTYGAEPIDAQIFLDDDGRNWLYFGGWGHGVVVELEDDMVTLKGDYLEITPPDYVEGPWMLKRDGVYYYMYSVGGWGDNSYGVQYVTGSSPTGPFSKTATKILTGDANIGTSTGHNSVVNRGDDYYIVYHRRYPNNTQLNDRIVCIDRMFFDENGAIKPVHITTEGVEANAL
ncbi:hypothetical protein ASPZODRAFT_128834 [Penicilliopsis zonata CBS 506.65]|uniref:Uncharacterized protein n=1 Tax=Penicilliopsis zonata CBS 506.65 TaxID=1073090 RepID=A0A1L9SSM7_9EURO|nr:hypothetical protein ASPZODRAFT_128834 [Penicilliopsis zonata CBS 506.65]OJJ50210.1 hypothetical protein ASPZODRAFT_128834 [Penicilliopsis zonata CBS 506.65]